MFSNVMGATKLPYYAVIFTSSRTERDEGYESTADRMVELASKQPGFLELETIRAENGEGITVSYWSSLEAIANWRIQLEHQLAQKKGKETWYKKYQVRVCRVDHESSFQS